MNRLHDPHATGLRRTGPPPIGPDGIQVEPPSYGLVAPRHSRRLQAEAIGAGARRLGHELSVAARAVRTIIACAGSGAAMRPPERLTSPCR